MIELVYILRAIVEEVACDEEDHRRKKCGRPMPPIKFSELEKFVFDRLRWEERIAI